MHRSERRATYESELARVLRSLERAARIADDLGDHGAEDDLNAAAAHVRSMLNESLNAHRHQRLAEGGQLRLS